MREIEVKYRLHETDPRTAAYTFAAAGVLWGAAVDLDDQAYAETGWSWDEPRVGRKFARLRTARGQHRFTLKIPVDNAMACIEHETAVDDRTEMAASLELIGFRPTVRIRNRRLPGRWGSWQVCLDQIEGLPGLYFEVEALR